MAAAVAAALDPKATVPSILTAATAYLPPRSARVMRSAIETTLALAEKAGDYEGFRQRYYDERLLPGIAMPDSRETVPVALALFALADGRPERAIVHAANFGRDADTIASMAGALAGAYRGVDAIPSHWVAKVQAESPRAHEDVARELVDIINQRLTDMRQHLATMTPLT